MQNWESLYEHIFKKLKENLPSNLTYHNWQHTLHVINMAEHIGKEENISQAELRLIKTAALFHDIGFIHSGKDHEEGRVIIAKKELPSFGYTEKEIDIISNMILATAIPQKPTNLLECVLADADLEYLGTDYFEIIGNTLYEELKHRNNNLSASMWNEIQIQFLQAHQYHTKYCLENRAPKKEMNLQKLLATR